MTAAKSTTFENMREVVIMEAFLQGTDRALANHIFDKEPEAVDDAVRCADNFISRRTATDQIFNKHEYKKNDNQKQPNKFSRSGTFNGKPSQSKNGHVVTEKPSVPNGNIVKRGDKKPQYSGFDRRSLTSGGDTQYRRGIVCYHCGKDGHMKFDCLSFRTTPNTQPTKVNQITKIKNVETEVKSINHVRIENNMFTIDNTSNEIDTENDVINFIVPDVKSNVNISHAVNKKVEENENVSTDTNEFVSEALVHCTKVTLLRDSGADVSIIKKFLVADDEYNGSFVYVKPVLSRCILKLPIAEVYVVSVHGNGIVPFAVADTMDSDTMDYDIIIGNHMLDLNCHKSMQLHAHKRVQ
jgi:hypothetical protein